MIESGEARKGAVVRSTFDAGGIPGWRKQLGHRAWKRCPSSGDAITALAAYFHYYSLSSIGDLRMELRRDLVLAVRFVIGLTIFNPRNTLDMQGYRDHTFMQTVVPGLRCIYQIPTSRRIRGFKAWGQNSYGSL